jgi:hypothetical protein
VRSEEVVLGRDFMAFYLGGSVVAEGSGSSLYEPEVQQRVQDAVLSPERFDGLAYYINPAPVAVAYSLLARLPYLWALHAHTLIMLTFLVIAMCALRTELDGLTGRWGIVIPMVVLWFPVAQTVTGGQNAALTLLLWVAAYKAVSKGHHAWAGVALGLLLFKPQYALPLIGLLLLRRRYRTVIVSSVVGVGGYVAGAVACGWNWPLRMMQATGGFYRQQENGVSGFSHISMVEAADFSLAEPLRAWGSDWATWIAPLSWGVVVVVIIALVVLWKSANPRDDRFGLYWAAVTASSLLISPHTQYYEVALLVLPLVLILDYTSVTGRVVSTGCRAGLLAAFLLYPFYGFGEVLQFQPLIVLPVWMSLWAVWLIRLDTQEAEQGTGRIATPVC